MTEVLNKLEKIAGEKSAQKCNQSMILCDRCMELHLYIQQYTECSQELGHNGPHAGLCEYHEKYPEVWEENGFPKRAAADFRVDLFQPRKRFRASEESFLESITATGGNTEPVICVDRGNLVVVAGHRRVAACMQLNLPVTYIIRDFTDQEASAFALSSNLNRDSMSEDEVTAAVLDYISNYDLHDVPILASNLQISSRTIQNILTYQKFEIMHSYSLVGKYLEAVQKVDAPIACAIIDRCVESELKREYARYYARLAKLVLSYIRQDQYKSQLRNIFRSSKNVLHDLLYLVKAENRSNFDVSSTKQNYDLPKATLQEYFESAATEQIIEEDGEDKEDGEAKEDEKQTEWRPGYFEPLYFNAIQNLNLAEKPTLLFLNLHYITRHFWNRSKELQLIRASGPDFQIFFNTYVIPILHSRYHLKDLSVQTVEDVLHLRHLVEPKAKTVCNWCGQESQFDEGEECFACDNGIFLLAGDIDKNNTLAELKQMVANPEEVKEQLTAVSQYLDSDIAEAMTDHFSSMAEIETRNQDIKELFSEEIQEHLYSILATEDDETVDTAISLQKNSGTAAAEQFILQKITELSKEKVTTIPDFLSAEKQAELSEQNAWDTKVKCHFCGKIFTYAKAYTCDVCGAVSCTVQHTDFKLHEAMHHFKVEKSVNFKYNSYVNLIFQDVTLTLSKYDRLALIQVLQEVDA